MMDEPYRHHALAKAFLDAIEAMEWAKLADVCTPDLVIWHNVDHAEKRFVDYSPVLVAVREAASEWKYAQTGYWEADDRFFRASRLDGRTGTGDVFRADTFIVGEIREERIARIDEYYDSAAITALRPG